MKYLSLIPLFGGAIIGALQAIGHAPEAILSYSEFLKNDAGYLYYSLHVLNRHIKYVQLDKESYTPPEDIDLVISICPCTGLSSLNTKSRQEDHLHSKQKNLWMIATALYTLSTIKPKFYMGLNSLKLSSGTGELIRNKMIYIGNKYGYKLTIIRTDLQNYGIPQSRTRVIYVFSKGDKFVTFTKPFILTTSLRDYMQSMPADYVFKNTSNKYKILDKDLAYKFLYYNVFKSSYDALYKELLINNCNSFAYICKKGLADRFRNYTSDKRALRIINLVELKLAKGSTAFYDGTWLDRYTAMLSLNGRACEVMASPINNGYMISLAESMYLMGLPKDFRFNNKLYIDLPSHIDDKLFQNVSPAIVKYYVSQLLNPQYVLSNLPFLLLNYIPTKMTHKKRMLIIKLMI